ncbi:MAG TPA: TMEM165/GDT1 family protein [Polyangiaceae bacterium]|nr:TMEM165/GDT1 family protein [Polyangiaceae bacterium]
MGHFFSLSLGVFAVVFLAEVPDKTALAALVLATRHKPSPVFVGAAAALTVQSLVAVAAGQLMSLLPRRPVHVAAGLLFVVSAVLLWRRHEEVEGDGAEDEGLTPSFWRTASLVFGVVFVAEWGDLTQLATAALAARYAAPFAVFAGATAALWAVTAIAVFVGNRAARWLDPRTTQRAAAVLFALVGVALAGGLL